jgi:hypothetical protein
MSLVDLGIEAPFSLPARPLDVVQTEPALADFIGNLHRPIGQITPELAGQCVVSASIHDEQRVALASIAEVSRKQRTQQERELGIQITTHNTDFGDRVFSLLSPRNCSGFHRADNLIVVEEQFLFGHTHVFKYLRTHTDIARVEHDVKPLQVQGLDRFNLIQHRAKVALELLQRAS